MKAKEIVERIVNKLFCLHKWKCFRTITVDNDFPGGDGSIYYIWIFYCENVVNLKNKTFLICMQL